MKFQKK